jgi:hypothetical protein
MKTPEQIEAAITALVEAANAPITGSRFYFAQKAKAIWDAAAIEAPQTERDVTLARSRELARTLEHEKARREMEGTVNEKGPAPIAPDDRDRERVLAAMDKAAREAELGKRVADAIVPLLAEARAEGGESCAATHERFAEARDRILEALRIAEIVRMYADGGEDIPVRRVARNMLRLMKDELAKEASK